MFALFPVTLTTRITVRCVVWKQRKSCGVPEYLKTENYHDPMSRIFNYAFGCLFNSNKFCTEPLKGHDDEGKLDGRKTQSFSGKCKTFASFIIIFNIIFFFFFSSLLHTLLEAQ